MDPLWLAQSKLRRRKFDQCIDICSNILEKNPYDKAAWFLKTKAMTECDYIDDCDLEQESLGDLMINEEKMASLPRPGTSIKSVSNNSRIGSSGIIKPRLLTGFCRPSTSTKNAQNRPMTMNGRLLRLGTQSMLQDSDKFINPNTLKLTKFFKDGILSKLLINFLFYSEKNIEKCLELASLSTKYFKFKDYFYKMRIGQCYYLLGMYRDSEKQFKSCLKNHGINISLIPIYLYLAKIYIKLDQPKNALNCYNEGLKKLNCNNEISFILGKARIYELLNDIKTSTYLYKNVLQFESSNIESMACLGSQYFYQEQYEIALQFFKRLLQIGIQNSELWNNIALCSYYNKQYDIVLQSFKMALNLCQNNDILFADIWYNISIVLISCGDIKFALKALKIVVSINPKHGEAWNNLAILQYKIDKTYNHQSITYFETANNVNEYLYEPLYNSSLAYYQTGNCQLSLQKVLKSMEIFPDHYPSKKLHQTLQNEFNIL